MTIIHHIEKHLKTFAVKQHKHLFWEIIYVTEGKGVFTFEDGQSLSYQKGQVICIPPHLLHCNKSSSGFKNIHLTLEAWTPNSSQPILIKASSHATDLHMLMELAYKYFYLFTTKSELLLSLTRSIVACLDFLIEAAPISKTTLALQEAIINNYTDCNFSLDDAYDTIHYSREYVRKIFIKERGVSPLTYLMDQRIDCAKQLLTHRQHSNNNYTIAEIAVMSGFSDPLYFSRCFKKATGVSPKEYN